MVCRRPARRELWSRVRARSCLGKKKSSFVADFTVFEDRRCSANLTSEIEEMKDVEGSGVDRQCQTS